MGETLISIGLIIVVIAAILLFHTSPKGKRKISGGTIVMFGPLPIIFGTDAHSLKSVLILAFILTAALIVTMIVVTLMGIAFLFVASILSDGGQIDFGGIVIIGPISILTGAVQKLHG